VAKNLYAVRFFVLIFELLLLSTDYIGGGFMVTSKKLRYLIGVGLLASFSLLLTTEAVYAAKKERIIHHDRS